MINRTIKYYEIINRGREESDYEYIHNNLIITALNALRAVEILKEKSLPDYKSPYLDGDDYE